MPIGLSSPTTNVYRLASCLALLGCLLASKSYAAQLALPPAVTSQQCQVLVDSRVVLKGSPSEILPGSTVSTYSGALPESIFINQAKFNQQQIAETIKLFPNENYYRLTLKNGQHYLVLRSNQIVGRDIRTVAVRTDLPTRQNPLSCSEIKGWQNALVAKQRYLKLLSDYLLDKPASNAGEALIDAEALAYINKGKPYPVLEIRKKYNDLLKYLKDTHTSTNDILTSVEEIRDVLFANGLTEYRGGDISFLDFFKSDGGTNCQGQTMLFMTLFLDLKIKNTDAQQKFGLQILADHIRPVFYDGKNILDAVYATKEVDTGDPVFAPKYLLYLALKQHAADLPEGFINQFANSDFTKPYNPKNRASAALSKLGGSKFANLVPKDIEFEVTLFDFSGIKTFSYFGGSALKKSTISQAGDLHNPEGNNASNWRDWFSLKNPNEPVDVVVFDAGYIPADCYEKIALTEILSAEELEVFRQVKKFGRMSPEDLKKYYKQCPGTAFTRMSKDDKSFLAYRGVNQDNYGYTITQISLPDELIKKIDRNLPYAQKIDLIFDYFLNIYIENIEKLTRALEVSDTSVFLNIASLRNLPNAFDIFGYDKLFYEHEKSFFTHPKAIAAQAKLIKSYLDLENRIVDKPEIYLDALNKYFENNDPTSKSASALIANALPIFFKDGFNRSAEKARLKLANLLHLNVEDLKKEISKPFATAWKTVILSDKIRIALEPMTSTELTQLKFLQTKMPLLEKSNTSKPQNGNIDIPKFPIAMSQQRFLEICQNNPGMYLSSGNIYWQCPSSDALQEMNALAKIKPLKLPKEFIVKPETFDDIFLTSLLREISGPILLRLISGLSIDHFKKTLSYNKKFLTTKLSEAYYLLNASNPTLQSPCDWSLDLVFRNTVTIRNCPLSKMRFDTFELEDTNAPKWIRDGLSLSYWMHAKIKLHEDFAELVGPVSPEAVISAQNKVANENTYQLGSNDLCRTRHDDKAGFQFILSGSNEKSVLIVPCTVVEVDPTLKPTPAPRDKGGGGPTGGSKG